MFKKDLIKKIKELEELITKAQAGKHELNKTIYNQRAELVAEKKAHSEIKKLVREQTEADLLLVSMKIQKEVLDGRAKEEIKPLVNEQNLLQQRLSGLQAQRQGSFGLGELFRNIWG